MLLKQASAPGYLFLTGLRRSDRHGGGISGKFTRSVHSAISAELCRLDFLM
jgi:hypothetical protein